MNENYPSAGEVVRNISALRTPYRCLITVGKFRIVDIDPPYFAGYQYWVVNEKGFLWEAAETVEAAEAYLRSEEALEYQDS